MIEALIEHHEQVINGHVSTFERRLDIDWNDRLIGITGARGVGKTSFILNHYKHHLSDKKALYISLDDLWFSNNHLLDVADAWYKMGGTHLLIDEIHKYPNWSQELKNIYDRYNSLHVIFTGSSVLHIYSGNADLSRRAVLYTLNGLSFREFLNIESGQSFPILKLEDILGHHADISREICKKVKPFAYFRDYLQYGYYPYYLESRQTYHRKLMNTINIMLEADLPYLRHVEVKYIHKIKKLLYLLSQSVPFQPNVSKLAGMMEVSRNTIMLYLNYLEECKLINLLHSEASGDALLAKPEKVYLHHPNLLFTLSPKNTNPGTLRETFFYNQVNNIEKVQFAKSGDFLVNGQFVFEVGGKDKSFSQIKEIPDSYIAADEIEFGYGHRIPLWLFGFLY